MKIRNRAWRRFRKHRPARIGAVAFFALAIVAVAASPFSASWFNVQDLNHTRARPTLQPVSEFELFSDAEPARLFSGLAKVLTPTMYRAAGWMGYDDLGRSLLYRTLLGWLVSLAVGLGAAAISVTIGVTWGATAALAGGKTDACMMRIVDVLYGLPYVLFVILMKVVFEAPLTTLFNGRSQLANVAILFIAIGAVSWLTMARVIRGQVLSLRAQPFVEAARAGGAGTSRILLRHLLPNLVGPIVVYATLIIPQAILQESFLSFLGIGVAAPLPSLGRLAADGVQAVNSFVGFWWLIAFPCGILVITLVALNFIGDGLRDAFDPKSRSAAIL